MEEEIKEKVAGQLSLATGLLLPFPLWGGVGGGGRGVGHISAAVPRPPAPTLPQPKPRIRGFRPINRGIEIGNSRFRLGGGRRGGVALGCTLANAAGTAAFAAPARTCGGE